MGSSQPVAKIQFEVGLPFPFLVREAAERAGYEFSTLWLRDRLCRLLADELGEETYEELLAQMPTSWRENPGAVRLADKQGVQMGQVG